MRPLLVLEDTTRPRWRLFRVLGVEWWATRWAWVSPLFWVGLGYGVAWGDPAGGGSGAARLATAGLVYGLLLYLTNTAHTLGHIAAARLARTPMDAVVLTSTRDVNVYRGPKREVAERVRVVRSLGGPLANAVVGAVCLGAGLGLADGSITAVTPVGWLRMFGVFNVCIAAWTLAPVPTMDGWIVWRWIFRRGGSRA